MTPEQQTIQRTARDLVRSRLPVLELRRLRDTHDPLGIDRAAWRTFAELGLAGLTLPEACGGSGLGFVELGIVLEECGRQLAATPYLSTVVLAGGALLLAGRRELLPAIATGERILALAHDEGTRHRRAGLSARVEAGRLSAEKSFVLDGHIADAFVVSAADGLYLVRADAPGVAVTRTVMVDSRNAAQIRFAAAPAERLGDSALLERVLDRGTVALAAEMLGGMTELFERTVAFLKTRHQFGVPIGSFQALKHRAAQLYCELELTRSVVGAALAALDARTSEAPQLASAAKARASDAYVAIANEAVQLHGGVGVTDELDIGLYLKRARTSEQLLGSAAFHRDRWARLAGY